MNAGFGGDSGVDSFGKSGDEFLTREISRFAANDCGFASLGTEWIQFPPTDLSHLGDHQYGVPEVEIEGFELYTK